MQVRSSIIEILLTENEVITQKKGRFKSWLHKNGGFRKLALKISIATFEKEFSVGRQGEKKLFNRMKKNRENK